MIAWFTSVMGAVDIPIETSSFWCGAILTLSLYFLYKAFYRGIF